MGQFFFSFSVCPYSKEPPQKTYSSIPFSTDCHPKNYSPWPLSISIMTSFLHSWSSNHKFSSPIKTPQKPPLSSLSSKSNNRRNSLKQKLKASPKPNFIPNYPILSKSLSTIKTTSSKNATLTSHGICAWYKIHQRKNLWSFLFTVSFSKSNKERNLATAMESSQSDNLILKILL